MKCLRIVILFTLMSIPSLKGSEQGKHLFLLSGQSNMVGLDPKLTFIPTVAKEFGADRVIAVKDAHDGQPILRWYKNWKPLQGDAPRVTGDLYDKLMDKVRAAIKDKPIATVTFLWMQGEADAIKDGEVYAASLKGLLDQLKTDLGRKDINFVIGRLSDHKHERFQKWDMVRKVQVEFAESDPYGAWINTDDLNDGLNSKGEEIKNDLHYSVEGYKTLGQRFADKAIELIHKRVHSSNTAPVK